jgi:hypothetical protein
MKTAAKNPQTQSVIQKVRDDLFDEELEGMDERQRSPRGRRFDMNPDLMSFENQDEVDAQVLQDLRDMQTEYFGKPGGMGAGKHEKPWVKDQFEPNVEIQNTEEELEELRGISESELSKILDQEYGLEELSEFPEDEMAALEDDDIPVKEPEIDWDFWKKTPQNVSDGERIRSDDFDITDRNRRLSL